MWGDGMIIQGSNAPMLLIFDEDASCFSDLSVLLSRGGRKLRHWTMEDLQIDGSVVTVPLTQEETMVFPEGECTIEVKWLDSEGETQFAEVVRDTIAGRRDKTLLEVKDSGSS